MATRARILADYVSGGATAAEFDYLDGVTSNIQTQFTAKAPIAGPTFTGTTTVSGDLVPSTPLSHRNHLINGAMMVDQRQQGNTYTSGSNNDDTYTLDRWYILSDGNDIIDVSRGGKITDDGMKAIGLDVENTNAKFGIAQIVENKNCGGLISNEVTFSFKAKVSATTKLDNVKAGIIAWSSTADAVTSDVVSAWAVEGTNPTLASNLTFENTPANLNVTTTAATYSVSATIDTSSTTNIIVFIWSDVTDTTAGDVLYISDCQLERGSNATPFEHRSYADELASCQRYFFSGLDKHRGGTGAGTVNSGKYFTPVIYLGSSKFMSMWNFPVAMRDVPTFSEGGGADWFSVYRADGSETFDSMGSIISHADGRHGRQFLIVERYGTVSSSGGNGGIVSAATTDNSYVWFSAEL